jgi:hypothetical protein
MLGLPLVVEAILLGDMESIGRYYLLVVFTEFVLIVI